MEKKRKKLTEKQVYAVVTAAILGVVGIGTLAGYVFGYKFGYSTGTNQLSDALLEYLNSTIDWEPDIIVGILNDYCTIFDPKVH